MPNTYTQVYIHAVFAVKNRKSLLKKDWREYLFKYMTGIVQQNGHKMIIVNGVSNHVHMFIGMKPIQSLSSLMQDVKRDSSKWINDNKLVNGRFEWQSGFGAFSYALSQIDNVYKYIANQERHHGEITFKDEFEGLLKEYDISFDSRYILKDIL
ncbi:MAG: IS200/IS605 family transposase [Bacteroidales bacterium]|nr:IS200/IS605 family transposase [Bacteroidales bacterium]